MTGDKIAAICEAMGIDFNWIVANRDSLIPYTKDDLLRMLKEKLEAKKVAYIVRAGFILNNDKWSHFAQLQTGEIAFAATELDACLAVCHKAFVELGK